jgi:hypothetical protein
VLKEKNVLSFVHALCTQSGPPNKLLHYLSKKKKKKVKREECKQINEGKENRRKEKMVWCNSLFFFWVKFYQ